MLQHGRNTWLGKPESPSVRLWLKIYVSGFSWVCLWRSSVKPLNLLMKLFAVWLPLITFNFTLSYSITLSPNGRFKLWRAWMVSGLRSVCHMITASFVNVFWLLYVLSFGNTQLSLHSISKLLHFNCNVAENHIKMILFLFSNRHFSFTTSSKCSDAPFSLSLLLLYFRSSLGASQKHIIINPCLTVKK